MDGRRWTKRLVVATIIAAAGCKSPMRSQTSGMTAPPGMTNPPQIAQSKLSIFAPKPPGPVPQPTEVVNTDKKKTSLSPDTVAAVTDAHVDAAFNNEEMDNTERLRNLDAARQMYERTLQRDPDNYSATRGLARLYTRLGEKEQAKRMYMSLVQKNPQDHKAMYEFALSLARFEDWVDAESVCRRAMSLDPSSIRYPKTLGLCLARQGRYEEGLNTMAMVLPEADARVSLAKIFADMGQRDAAVQQLQIALQVDPKSVAAQEMAAAMSGATPAGNPAAEGIRQVGFTETPQR